MQHRKSDVIGSHLLSFALGVLIFFVFFGPELLLNQAPFLSSPAGDIATELAGYLHFIGDRWRFPLFIIPTINQPEGSNLLFTGGVPILAAVAKLVRSTSGDTILLFGPWYLICCALQTHSFFFLMRQMTEEKPYLLAIASVVAGLNYAFLTRMGHISLVCHFICIYSVGLLFATANSKKSNRVILLASAGLAYLAMFVFAYLAICNTVLFLGTVASLAWLKRVSILRGVAAIAAFALIELLLAAIGGYFWGATKAAPAALIGYSIYGLDLGSLFSPPKSILFPTRPFLRDWWEGDFYLGLIVYAPAYCPR